MRRLIVVPFTAVVWLLAVAAPAAAVTCSPDDPATDARAVRADPDQVIFRGVVESVEAGVGRDAAATERPTSDRGVRGRRAEIRVTEVVRGDVPKEVTIIGGSSDPNLYNTAERFFAPGVEYEFYPRNSRSPFREDLCTQTQTVSGAAEDGQNQASTPTSTSTLESTSTTAAPVAFAGVGVDSGHPGGGGATVLVGVASILGAAAWISFARDGRYRVRRIGGATFIALAVVAATLTSAPMRADAGHNLDGQGRHWGRGTGQAQATPTVRNQTGDANFTTPLQQAINTWNQTPHTDFVYVLGGSASCDHLNMTFNGVTTCLRSPLSCPPLADAAGCAWHSLVAGTNHFARVVIYINPTHANSAGLRRSAYCHELGHALGLGHRGPTNTTSCLRDGISTNNQAPDQHDFDQIFLQTNHTH